MKRRVLLTVLWTIALALGAGWPALSLAASTDTGAIVRLEPAAATLRPGESAEFSVRIDDVTALYGAEIHLGFDPVLLHIEDVDSAKAGVQIQPGPLLDPAQGFVAANQVDHERGELVYALTLLVPAAPVSGSGELARFRAVALSPGTNEWRWGDVILSTGEGESIPVRVEVASVMVRQDQPTGQPTGAPPAATPTAGTGAATPSPTSSSPAASPGLATPPTSTPAGTGAPPQPGTTEPTNVVPTQATPTHAIATRTATLTPVPGYTAAPEDLARTTDVATPAATIEPWPQAPTGTVPGSSADEGASLSPLPAVLAALAVALLLLGGRYLYRRQRSRQK